MHLSSPPGAPSGVRYFCDLLSLAPPPLSLAVLSRDVIAVGRG